MSGKMIALAMGVGAAVGAVGIMMTPKDCSVRKLADKAATKTQDLVTTAGDKLTQKMDMQ